MSHNTAVNPIQPAKLRIVFLRAHFIAQAAWNCEHRRSVLVSNPCPVRSAMAAKLTITTANTIQSIAFTGFSAAPFRLPVNCVGLAKGSVGARMRSVPNVTGAGTSGCHARGASTINTSEVRRLACAHQTIRRV